MGGHRPWCPLVDGARFGVAERSIELWRASCNCELPRREEKPMRGVITRREVLLHPLMIARLFGLGAYCRCLRAAFSPAPSTFLDVVCR
jgi:hypothetical protein